ncbi:MAG: pyruvate kinase [Actinobacteria bacterium]|nr:pyruvate kinase [Actinomycetota bacterium]
MARRTKIIATIGPASEGDQVLRGMIRAGMDVARLGMAHSTLEENAERLKAIRRIAAEEGRTVGVLVDLTGPKVRAASFGEDPVEFVEDATVQLRIGHLRSRASVIEVDYEAFFRDVEPGGRMSIGDGRVILQLGDLDGERISGTVVHGGVLSGRPGLHIPADRLSLSAPTPEDLRAVGYFLEHEVDMIALSFVRSADDIGRLGTEPHPNGPLVVAKIETAAALADLQGIIEKSGAVMVARGDLGNECGIEVLPVLQKQIIRQCISLGRPAITATQMFESMIAGPEPTRAEVSDVANAIWDGSSAVMLSGETAVGIDPANVVATMSRVAEHADENFDHHGWSAELAELRLTDVDDPASSVTDAMTFATARAVEELGISTIVCVSGSGFTVRSMARFRPSARILGYSADERTVGQLSLSWGTEPFHLPEEGEVDRRVARALDLCRDQAGVPPGELVAVLAGTDPTSRATNELRLERVPGPA